MKRSLALTILTAILCIGVLAESVHATGPTGLTTTNALSANVDGAFGGATAAYQPTAFFAQGRYWLFYETASCTAFYAQNYCIYYSTSLDGYTWATPTNTTLSSRVGFAINNNATMVFIAFGFFNSTSAVYQTDFTDATLSATGSASFTSNQALANVSPHYFPASLVLTTTGLVFIATDSGSGGGGTRVFISTTSALNAWTNSTAPIALGILTALPNGNVYGAETTSGTVSGSLYSGGAWGASETIYVMTSGNRIVGAMYSDSVDIYLFVRDGGTLNLMFCVRSDTVAGWGCNAIQNTSASQTYSATYSSALGIFTVIMLQSGAWSFFTFTVVNNNPTPLQTLSLVLTSFTTSINGATFDTGYTSINNNIQFTDFYWTEGGVSPYTINSAQIFVKRNGSVCIGGTCGGSLPNNGGGFSFLTTTLSTLFGPVTLPVQLLDPTVITFVLIVTLLLVTSTLIGKQSWIHLPPLIPHVARHRSRKDRRSSLV